MEASVLLRFSPVCALVVLSLGGARAQPGAPSIAVSSVRGYDGQALPIDIVTSLDLTQYNAARLTVDFPSHVAEVTISRPSDPPEIDQPDSLLYNPLTFAYSSPGEVVIGLVSTRATRRSGRLVRFSLTLRPDAPAGIYLLHLSAELPDPYGEIIQFQTVDGQLIVLGLRPGDLDGDGQVDRGDVRIALRSLLGGLALTKDQSAAADLSGDGKVDLADIRLLLREALGL